MPALALGCGEAPGDEGTSDEAAIIGGTASGPEDDATVLLLRDGSTSCTATLIAPNVLLTALHSVAETTDLKVGKLHAAESLTVHVGAKRDRDRPSLAAVGVKILVPADAVEGVTMEGHDIALIIVQSTAPSFDRLRPRAPRKAPLATGEKVLAVGWGYLDNVSSATGELPLQRMRRPEVEILSGSGSHDFVKATMGGIDFGTDNRAGQLIAATAVCQGDSGGPAFDSAGNVAGVTSMSISARGQGCAEGSLSAYADVSAFRAFIEAGVLAAGDYECLTDSACGAAGTGRICDGTTHVCVDGCRVGGAACTSSTQCKAPSNVVGVVGTCSAPAPPNPPPAPPAPNPWATDSTDPTLPVVDTRPQCERDVECAAIIGEPRVCVLGACAAGCRVNAPLMPCGGRRTCAGTGIDPTVGACIDTPGDEATPLQPPVGTPSANGVTPNTPSVSAPVPSARAPGSTAPAPAKEKTSNNAGPVDQSGCSIGPRGQTRSDALFACVATTLMLTVAGLRRRRR